VRSPMSEGGHSHADSGHSHAAHSHAHGGSAHGHGVHVERGFVPDDTAAVTGLPRLERDWGRGRILFLDCQSGIPGDMKLAALLDLGVPREVIDAAIVAVGLPDASLTVRRGYAGALGATHVTVEAPGRQIERPYAEIKRLLSASTLDPDVRQLAARIFARLA